MRSWVARETLGVGDLNDESSGATGATLTFAAKGDGLPAGSRAGAATPAATPSPDLSPWAAEEDEEEAGGTGGTSRAFEPWSRD